MGDHEHDLYRVRAVPGGDPVEFRAYVQDELSLRHLGDLETRLNRRVENWAMAHEMHALLWHSARMAGRLADLLPPDERPKDDDIPGLLEGLSWDAVADFTPLQVDIIRPDTPGGDDVPPDDARE